VITSPARPRGYGTCCARERGATPELFFGNDGATEAAHHKSIDDFYTDAAAGTLPSFSFLDPDYGNQSQENPQNIVVGEALLARVVQAAEQQSGNRWQAAGH
jgi:hypothetical protein